MTAIFYPNCDATSGNGRFVLEARSPHNGTIRHRDGRKVSESEFGFKYREHQSEFRYQLLDNSRSRALARLFGGAGRRVVWERWQDRREDSPHELLVSDDGWAVIRTHGFRPEVIAVGPDGRDAMRVLVGGGEGDPPEPNPDGRAPVPVWPLTHVAFTTAGHYWSQHSWRYFFEYAGEPHFAWRASWGQRLVLNLGRGLAFTDEAQLSTALAAAVVAAERRGVVARLGALSEQMDEVRSLLTRRKNDEDAESDGQNSLWEPIRQASAALHLVGVHRIHECVPYLREWESIDLPSCSMGSNGLSGGWWLETQLFRPIVHHALKLLSQEPRGFSTYNFTNFGDNTGRRFPMPERIPDRRQRTRRVNRHLSAEDVLQLLGSPDYVSQRVHDAGTPSWRATENWEYDFPEGDSWVTLRLVWEERKRRGVMLSAEEVPPYWLDTDEREAEFLRM